MWTVGHNEQILRGVCYLLDENKVLGRVTGVKFGYEDHGILTLYIDLEKEDGFHQSFGGYSLDGYDEKLKRRKGTAGGLDFVIQVMKVFKASKLEDIVGKMCYALYDQEGLGRTIQGLQALDIDGGETFLIDTWQKQWFPKESINA